MAETQKILGQSAPTAGVLTDAYTAAHRAVVSSLTVCNRDPANSAKFRLSVARNAEADASKQYIYYDLDVDYQDTFIATVGITLGVGDVIRVYADQEVLSFNFFGVEIT